MLTLPAFRSCSESGLTFILITQMFCAPKVICLGAVFVYTKMSKNSDWQFNRVVSIDESRICLLYRN